VVTEEAIEIEATYSGDEVKCRCGRVIGVGVVPEHAEARLYCKACAAWVRLPLRPRAAPPSRYPMGG
jgi:hypothetical protein